jgi:hypothetical protein
MVHLDEGYEIGIVAVIVLDQNAVILQPHDRDPIAEILREGCDPETERGARAQLLPWCW